MSTLLENLPPEAINYLFSFGHPTELGYKDDAVFYRYRDYLLVGSPTHYLLSGPHGLIIYNSSVIYHLHPDRTVTVGTTKSNKFPLLPEGIVLGKQGITLSEDARPEEVPSDDSAPDKVPCDPVIVSIKKDRLSVRKGSTFWITGKGKVEAFSSDEGLFMYTDDNKTIHRFSFLVNSVSITYVNGTIERVKTGKFEIKRGDEGTYYYCSNRKRILVTEREIQRIVSRPEIIISLHNAPNREYASRMKELLK